MVSLLQTGNVWIDLQHLIETLSKYLLKSTTEYTYKGPNKCIYYKMHVKD